ncbi:hypothetical protein D0U02_31760 [Burkholderia pseudomallei]|nr:hypothetical protein EGY15_29300 [Burkholderia pseudomallei]EIF68455.1 hypothetical protein BP354E_6201 [Burkholderia pseudomallei 354e]EIF79102.1 hypothetical protein BP354A_3656 [Burkholderia pseudomallei 354a]PNX11958.1 hypothetical protein CF650_27635 [Burkholderia sp. 129]PNX26394.1 hypothetical protein CF647_25975 [Burkholderia sp. 117]
MDAYGGRRGGMRSAAACAAAHARVTDIAGAASAPEKAHYRAGGPAARSGACAALDGGRPIRHGAGGRPIERATPHVPHAGRCRAHIGLTCGYATITAAYMHAMPQPRRGVFAMATSRTIMAPTSTSTSTSTSPAARFGRARAVRPRRFARCVDVGRASGARRQTGIRTNRFSKAM